MTPGIVITTGGDLPQVGDRFARAGAALPGIADEKVAQLAQAIADLGVTYVREATPIGVSEPHLYEGTESRIHAMGGGAHVEIAQPKTVGAKAWILADLLIFGHRIVTRSGVDTGRVVPPNDYITPILDPLQVDINALVAQTGEDIVVTVAGMLA